MYSHLEIPKNLPDLSGKTALITGAGQGIGRCLALSFARAGAKVFMADIDAAAGGETMQLLQESRCIGHFIQTDVSNEEQVRHLVDTAAADGGLDYLINNAAIANAGAAHVFSSDLAAFDRVLAVNLRGPFILARLAAEKMINREAAIVNIASTRAFMSEARTEGYAASKGGIVALTHALAVSLAKWHIRVNSVSPGWIDTTPWQKGFPQPVQWSDDDKNQHPAGRVGKPADIAAACLWLCSTDAGFITGENLVIDGGMTRKMIYV